MFFGFFFYFVVCFFFFKQKTAYEMRISDWSSDVCSSDLYTVLNVLAISWPPVRSRKITGDATMGIDVDLLFHPVGQGMFASGHLKRTNSNDTEFSWIYDCGSASAGQLEIGAVNRLAAHLGGPKPRIDLLVISHFDHDHISGIPHLLSTFDVKRILIPLVPLWARLLVASQLGLSITQEEQSLILDPVGTLSALPEGNAPDEIVIVSQTTGGDERSPPWEPEGSPDEPSFDIHVEKDERERNPEATPGYSPVAAGSRTEISWLRKSGRITVGNLWEFVPYNDPITIGMASPALVNQALVLNGQLLSATSQQQRAAVLAAIKSLRSEARRVGKEGVRKGKSR